MKKHLKALVIFFVLLALLTSSGTVSAFALNVEEVSLWDYDYYGDVNGDYNVTVKDATALQKYLAKLSDLDIYSRLKADVNGDERLTIFDATEIQKFIALKISCFEVDPAYRVVADGEPVKVEGVGKKVNISIPKDGYYCFTSKSDVRSYRYFEVYRGNEYVAGEAGDFIKIEDFAYVKAGLYTTYVMFSDKYSVVYETEFSVTSANEKMPYDVENARELNDGDRIDIKAGEEKLIFKVDPKNSLVANDTLKIYTQGEDPKVSFMFIEDTFKPFHWAEYDYVTGGNTECYYNFDKHSYLVITQDKGGSDFTLCCENYSTGIIESADELSLNEKVEIDFSDSGDWVDPYVAYVSYKFTPPQDGYYRLSFNAESGKDCYVYTIPYEFCYPDNLTFIEFDATFSESSDSGKSVAFLEKDKTYFFSLEIRGDEDSTLSLILEKSSEEEYKTWINPEYDPKAFEGFSDIGLGEKVTLTVENKSEDNNCFKYKFTPKKDMTVVAYTEGANDAYINIYSEAGDSISWTGNGSVTSGDIRISIKLDAGETCYFDITSLDYFSDVDTFTFCVADIDDYTSFN